jgi:hypothetical protein
MSWFTVKRGRLAYRGRLSRDSYIAWLKTSDGAARLHASASAFRFRALAPARARRALWRPLELAARTEPLRTAIQKEAAHFGAAMAEASYAPGLPRTHIALHRLMLVPRALVAARARTGVRQRLWNLPALAAVDESVRAFFCEQLLIEMDRALEEAKPSAARAVAAAEGWSCVAADRPYIWVDPLWSGAHWAGHLFMYEFPRVALSRAQRKELDGAVAQLQQSIGSLSRLQREALVRTAVGGLTPASAR